MGTRTIVAHPTQAYRWQWWTLGGLGVCLLAGVAYFLLSPNGKTEAGNERTTESASRHAAIQVEVVHPRNGAMDRTTAQPGTVQAYESVHLYAGVSGYLRVQNVDIGDRIK